MTATWVVVAVVGVVTIAIKALGPMLLGGKPLPPRATVVVVLLAPALLAALVAVNTLGGDRELEIDARLPGVLAAAVAIKLKAPVLIVVVVAALGAAIALTLTPFTPAGVPIIAASAACLLGLRATGDRPIEDPRR